MPVLIGHDALDGGDDKLIREPHFELLQMVFEVGRWGHENQRVAGAHHLVDVCRECDVRHLQSEESRLRQ